jgi:hypothetical protein
MLNPSCRSPRRIMLAFGFGLRLDRQFILRSDITPFDTEISGAVDTDEGAGVADFFRCEVIRPCEESSPMAPMDR